MFVALTRIIILCIININKDLEIALKCNIIEFLIAKAFDDSTFANVFLIIIMCVVVDNKLN